MPCILLELAAPLITAEASPAERGQLHLQRVRCAYYRASLAGASQDADIEELRVVLREAESLQDQRLLADVRDQLGLASIPGTSKEQMEEPRRLFEQALDARRKLRDQGASRSLFHMELTLRTRSMLPPKKCAARCESARSALHRRTAADST